ncbi:hypothetical protein Leryth_001943 [Lithospermum erythrorhizon]|nr:hypothetical protein Leryth_001943 [Lithospermum erythrorhizon]
MEPNGTIIFTTVGRPFYGFDIFSITLPSNISTNPTDERRLTDGVSVNFNGQFVDDDDTIVFISERTGSPSVYTSRTGLSKPKKLELSLDSLFFDRPVIKNKQLFFISAHEQPEKTFKSWSALYSTRLDNYKTDRVTPKGCVDFSPSVSETGKFLAVASYGTRSWGGEFRDLLTDIVVFPVSDTTKRVNVAEHGGWPTWSGDDKIYFHRQSDDGWWSIFRVDLPADFESSGAAFTPLRITPPGVHCFTPAVIPNTMGIAVATRRRGTKYRHIEVFNVEKQTFSPVTEGINPDFHHYNPFISPGGTSLGYHRFRGESAPGKATSIVPNLEPVKSKIPGLRMVRLTGMLPAISPSAAFVAYNHDFEEGGGLKIVKSDGSKRWTLIKGRTVFCNSWSPVESEVIFTSIGPVFESVKRTVQIARIEFDPLMLRDDVEEVPINIKVLTKEESGNNAFPSVSPDGKFVVFRSGRSGHKNLYIVDAVCGEFDGGSIRKLTEGACIDTMPSWSPDGKLIAFSSTRHNPDNVEKFSIYVIKADGTGLKRIPVAGPEGSDEVDMERINHVCFSADCEWLLFAANMAGVTADPVSLPNQFQPFGDLYMSKLDGSGLRRLTWGEYENGTPCWHPTGGDLGMSCLKGRW